MSSSPVSPPVSPPAGPLWLRGLRVGLLSFALLFAGLAPTPAEAVGEAAPGFTLRDINAKNVSLSDFKGQVVLLQFWATWCGPCQAEMPSLQKFYTELKDKGFTVLSISIDDARASSMVKPLIMKNRYTFPVLLDTQTTVVAQYNPGKQIPYSVLIDREGRIQSVHMGYNPGDENGLRTEILALFGGN